MTYLIAYKGDYLESVINFKNIDHSALPDGRENYNYCIYREIYNEIISFLTAGQLVSAINVTTKELHNISLNENDKLILSEGFNNGPYWLRGSVDACKLLEIRNKEVWNNVVNKDDARILYWPSHFGIYLKRYVGIISNYAYNFPLEKYLPAFIKTISKHQSQLLLSSDDMDATTIYITDGTKFILSEVMNIKEDDYGTLEYRVYVINDKVAGISRYLDYETPEIPEQVKEYTEDLVNKLTKEKIHNYTVDICETDKGIDIVEFNNIASSGRYSGIDPDNVVKCVMELM